jgi:hypothetical protein
MTMPDAWAGALRGNAVTNLNDMVRIRERSLTVDGAAAPSLGVRAYEFGVRRSNSSRKFRDEGSS